MTRIDSHLYRCDVCGKVGKWDKSWSWFGSLGLQDERPQDVPTLCSNQCELEFRQGMAVGRIKVPNVKYQGYQVKIIGVRAGY